MTNAPDDMTKAELQAKAKGTPFSKEEYLKQASGTQSEVAPVVGQHDDKLGNDPDLSHHDSVPIAPNKSADYMLPHDADYLVRKAEDMMQDLSKGGNAFGPGEERDLQNKKLELAKIGRHLKGHGYDAGTNEDLLSQGHSPTIPHTLAGVENAIKRPEYIKHAKSWSKLAEAKEGGDTSPRIQASMDNYEKYFQKEGIDLPGKVAEHQGKTLDKFFRKNLKDYGSAYRQYMSQQAEGDTAGMRKSMSKMNYIHGEFKSQGTDLGTILGHYTEEFKQKNPNYNWKAARAFSDDIEKTYKDQQNYPELETPPHWDDQRRDEAESLRNKMVDQMKPAESGGPIPDVLPSPSKEVPKVDPMLSRLRAHEERQAAASKEGQYDQGASNDISQIIAQNQAVDEFDAANPDDMADPFDEGPDRSGRPERHPMGDIVNIAMNHPARGTKIPGKVPGDPERSAAILHVSDMTQDPVAHAMLMDTFGDASQSFTSEKERYDGLQQAGGMFKFLGGTDEEDPAQFRQDRTRFFQALSFAEDPDSSWTEEAKAHARNQSPNWPPALYADKTNQDKIFPQFQKTVKFFRDNPEWQEHLDHESGESIGDDDLENAVWETLKGIPSTQKGRQDALNNRTSPDYKDKLQRAMYEQIGGGDWKQGVAAVDMIENVGKHLEGQLPPAQQDSPDEFLPDPAPGKYGPTMGDMNDVHPGRERAQGKQAASRRQEEMDELNDLNQSADDAGLDPAEPEVNSIEDHPSFGGEIDWNAYSSDPVGMEVQQSLAEMFEDEPMMVNEMMDEFYEPGESGDSVAAILRDMFHKIGEIHDPGEVEGEDRSKEGQEFAMKMWEKAKAATGDGDSGGDEPDRFSVQSDSNAILLSYCIQLSRKKLGLDYNSIEVKRFSIRPKRSAQEVFTQRFAAHWELASELRN